jgi:hypothetical protein
METTTRYQEAKRGLIKDRLKGEGDFPTGEVLVQWRGFAFLRVAGRGKMTEYRISTMHRVSGELGLGMYSSHPGFESGS